jgi:hypothetical protein
MTGLSDHKSVHGDPQVTYKQPVSKRTYTYFETYGVLFWKINDSCCGNTVKVIKQGQFLRDRATRDIHSHTQSCIITD